MPDHLGHIGDRLFPPAAVPEDPATTSAALEHTAREYLFQFGWATRVSGNALHLLLDEELALVLIPAHWASAVVDRLTVRHLYCPVLRIPGYASGFLVRCDSATATMPTPGGTRVLPPGSTIPLPPTRTEQGEITWARAPEPGRGHDVTVDDVVTAVEQAIDTVSATELVQDRPTLPRSLPLR